MEEKQVEKTPPKDPTADDSKPPGFEKSHIYNNDDVTSRAGNEDVSFSTDLVKVNHSVAHKDMVADEVVSYNSKPPSFENFIKENKACSGHLVLQEQANDVLHSNTDLKVVALDILWSDHNPILLHCKKKDFGLIPFKIFNSWFDRIDFKDMEMEGFDRNSVVIVLGATNHVDVLDETLRRSWIFDCVVMVETTYMVRRQAIWQGSVTVVSYAKGNQVTGHINKFSNVTYVHEK
ncbi:hypothetical protein Tco_0414538 [Tanacetum coccineum]